MRSERTPDRDDAVRAMLVQRAEGGPAPSTTRSAREGLRVGIVTGLVLAAIVAVSVVAIRVRTSAAPIGGTPASPVPTASYGLTLPSGVPLGRFTSEDGPDQDQVIHPDGLALAWVFECSALGAWSVSIPHDGGTSGDKQCGGGASQGTKGHFGDAEVHIRTTSRQRWTFTVVGIPETYVTPQPVLSPSDSAGTPVPFCTAGALSARFEAVQEPPGVTEVRGGQLVFTNTGDTSCALAGHPSVLFVDGGDVLGHHTMDRVDQRSSEEEGEVPVVLAPGGPAYVQLDWYLPSFYPENEEGDCVARTVHGVRVDLANRLAGTEQQGTLDVPIGTATACLQGAHGVDGRYGQLSATTVVDYTMEAGQ